MRVRDLFLILALGTALQSADRAVAAVRASGLSCTSSGGAVLSSGSDGRRLQVSNIGSSGQDGVDVSLRGFQGHSMQIEPGWACDPGTVMSFSWGATIALSAGGTATSHGRMSVGRSSSGIVLGCDLSEWASGSSMSCYLYRQGALVASSTCPVSTQLDCTSPPPSSLAMPQCSIEMNGMQLRPLRSGAAAASARFPSSVSVVHQGVPVLCDRVVFVADLDLVRTLDACAVRVTTPAGSSVHDVTFDSQGVVRFGASLSTDFLDLDDDGDALAAHVTSHLSPNQFHGELPLLDRMFVQAGNHADGWNLLQALRTDSPLMGLTFSPDQVFTLDPASDDRSSLEWAVEGTSSCSPDGRLASCRLALDLGQVTASASFAGMCADQGSITVLDHRQGITAGVIAGIAVAAVVSVAPPPGGPPVCGLDKVVTKSSSNISNNLTSPGGKVSPMRVGDAGASATVVSQGLSMSLRFADTRVFCVGGQCFTGDELVFEGSCSSGSCGSAVITVTGSQFSFQSCVSGACSPGSSTLSILDVVSREPDVIRASIPTTAAISTTSPVLEVPVLMDRADATPLRGTTVTLQLSPGLVLAGAMRENTMFSSISNRTTQLFVVDNGGGSYTVDLALLGPGCGPTSSGSLFSLFVSRAPGTPDGIEFVDILDAEAADCSGAPITTSAGGREYILLDGTSPTAITDLSATQCKSGNDADGTTCVSLVWSPRSNLDESVDIYRASYGNYPLFSRGPTPGSVPPPPTTCPPGGRFSLLGSSLVASCTAGTSSCTVLDSPSSRDEFYYLAVVRDRAGNLSPCSNMTDGTLDYHLGDVAGGTGGPPPSSTCDGDNQVTTADISSLGARYGSSLATTSPFTCLDVGPTADGTVDGRPSPDGRLSFRDLILYAINYSLVSMPSEAPASASQNELRLASVDVPGVGQTFDVPLLMDGAGDVQGLSVQLGWNAAVVEPVGFSQGELLSQQGRFGLALSPDPGVVDAAVFGVGSGIAGSGALARVTFRVRGEGDPGLRIASVEARDGQNQLANVGILGSGSATPGRTAIRMAFPNPFDQSLTIALALSRPGMAEVGVFDVAGRKVRTLVSGLQPAGERAVTWDGRDDAGARLGAGVYMLRLEAGGHRESRAVRLVK